MPYKILEIVKYCDTHENNFKPWWLGEIIQEKILTVIQIKYNKGLNLASCMKKIKIF